MSFSTLILIIITQPRNFLLDTFYGDSSREMIALCHNYVTLGSLAMQHITIGEYMVIRTPSGLRESSQKQYIRVGQQTARLVH